MAVICANVENNKASQLSSAQVEWLQVSKNTRQDLLSCVIQSYSTNNPKSLQQINQGARPNSEKIIPHQHLFSTRNYPPKLHFSELCCVGSWDDTVKEMCFTLLKITPSSSKDL